MQTITDARLHHRPTGVELARDLERVVRLSYPDRGPSDMHPGQWAVLRILAARGRATIGDIGRELGVTHAPASRAVGSLGRRGLIFVTTSMEDRRVRYVRLSDAGRSMLDHDPQLVLAELLDSYPKATRDGINLLLVDLTQKLKAAHR